MRTPQPEGIKGSLKWIQILVNDHPDRLNKAIGEQLSLFNPYIQWLSPLKSDQYAEYRDGSFLDLLGLSEFKNELRDFWPQRGPQWDALGVGRPEDTEQAKHPAGQAVIRHLSSVINPVFLVEAKANIPEIMSSLGAKSKDSIAKIRKSLEETRKYLRCRIVNSGKRGFTSTSTALLTCISCAISAKSTPT